MNFRRIILAVSMIALFQTSSFAQAGASWLRTAVSNALNPKISVIGDFVYKTGPGRENSFSLRETELAFQSEVDPNTRADFFVAFHGEEIEIEEGYITLLSLPFKTQARGGKFLAQFGRLNVVHSHELPQVDRPLALETFLGEEGLNDTGVEVSRVFAPFETFTEVSYAFLNGLGEEHHETETTTVTDTDGNDVTVAIHEEEESSKRNPSDYGHVGRVRVFKEITENTDVEIGASGAVHNPQGETQTKLGQGDITIRWKPVRSGGKKSITFRTSGIHSAKKLQAEGANPKETLYRFGGYSYLEARLWDQVAVGVRGDYVEAPETRGNIQVTRAVSPYVTFWANEFNRYRAQYQFKDIPGTQDEHIGWFQWVVVIGPHGAHAY